MMCNDESEAAPEVTISIPIERLRNLLRLAEEAAEDLEGAINQEYQGDHPVTVRRRNRDMESVRALDRAILLVISGNSNLEHTSDRWVHVPR